ncbi:SMI1/KNR4 family protein [Alkalimonas sp. NCh-2]|uniref:SMI1/KNR4 family protein n=1 Tax=Alkalimonas sp. NCh-2 TaxID=3144846 RepID=UPI0031F6976D
MFERLEAIIQKAKSNKNYSEGGSCLSDEVQLFETRLGVPLPDDYKYFISKYGYCFWFGEVVCGLVGENNKRYEKICCAISKNSYYHNLYNNNPSYVPVPKEGVVIAKWDGGGYYFLFSKESERAGEVGLFLTETFGQEVSKFSSFTDFLSYLVTGRPEPTLVSVNYDIIKLHIR